MTYTVRHEGLFLWYWEIRHNGKYVYGDIAYFQGTARRAALKKIESLKKESSWNG